MQFKNHLFSVAQDVVSDSKIQNGIEKLQQYIFFLENNFLLLKIKILLDYMIR